MIDRSQCKAELTTRGVRALDPLLSEITWDARLSGFGLRTRRSADAGRWRWVYSYRLGGRGGEQVKLSRPFAELTPEQARQWAEAERGRKGTSIGQRERAAAAKARLTQERATPSVQRLWDEYWQAEGRLKRAGRNYRQLWTTHLAPHFATRKVRDIGPAEVERFKAAMTVLPGACNRALALLSRMFSLAVKWGYRANCAPEHPVKGVTRYPQQPDPARPMVRLQHVWQRVRKAAGLHHGRIHDLRHTAATLALRATGSLTAVQAQLGHATMLTTRRYAHLMREGMIEMGSLLGQVGERAHTAAEVAGSRQSVLSFPERPAAVGGRAEARSA